MNCPRKICNIAPLLTLLLLACIVLSPVRVKAEQPGPQDAIKKFNSALLEAMKKADELGYRGRYKLLEPVIKDVFALSFMGTKSLGSYWKTLTPEQQKLYLDTYTDWTVSTYAGRFDGYSGERFEIVRETGTDMDTATVISRLIKSNEESVDFHYRLRQVRGKWLVVDIRISGVSQLAMTRAQFVSVMKNKGFDGLISLLTEKIREFSSGIKE